MGFQEAASDIVAFLSTLHFKSVVDHILAETRGNIYAPNELNRFAELSPTHQIRSASNSIRMGDVPDVRNPVRTAVRARSPSAQSTADRRGVRYPRRAVSNDPGSARSDPRRVECKIRRADQGIDEREEMLVQELFNEAFRNHGPDFAQALIDARDIAGSLCAVAFMQLRPDLTYSRSHEALLRADRIVTKGRFRDLISDCLDWRGISVPAREAKRPSRRDFARRSIVTKKIETIGLMRRL